jgi:phosphoribosyl 1,2-cyclic phosphodiesterase
MNNGSKMAVKFWGVRGSIPTPLAANMGYGGNTTCLEISVPGTEPVIIDGGSGMHGLGAELARQYAGQRLSLNVLMTHFHWDHIQGIPFFAPLYSAGNAVTFWSDHAVGRIQETLEGQMMSPYFPVPFNQVPGHRNFGHLTDRQRMGELTVRPFPLNHPQGAVGYRLEHGGKAIVHISDHEQGDLNIDRIILEHATGADVLIIDAQYTPEEYEQKRGWGHSTWKSAVETARAANVNELVLFHHDPVHDDVFVDSMVAEARRYFARTRAAREGETISL